MNNRLEETPVIPSELLGLLGQLRGPQPATDPALGLVVQGLLAAQGLMMRLLDEDRARAAKLEVQLEELTKKLAYETANRVDLSKTTASVAAEAARGHERTLICVFLQKYAETELKQSGPDRSCFDTVKHLANCVARNDF